MAAHEARRSASGCSSLSKRALIARYDCSSCNLLDAHGVVSCWMGSFFRKDSLMIESDDLELAWALARYQIVSAYVALDPPRGKREATRKELEAKTWLGPDGEPMAVTSETIRTWVRRYNKKGLNGLKNKVRPKRGVQVLDPSQIEFLCQLKKDVPERSLNRLIEIAENTKHFELGVLRRSTVHRVLQAHGLSKRKARTPDAQDLDRFEADFPNDLWQSDMLKGPWLPDPKNPGKTRQAYLFAFIDDHSRILLYGRFFFRENLPCLEMVFRRALQKFGVPRRVYYDNGQVYRSNHMKQIVATLGIYRPIFTKAYRPMGHGKIEAFNRNVRSTFLAELKASKISTLDGLNEAFHAWGEYDYNRRVHSELKESPAERYKKGQHHVRYPDEADLHQAFLFKENRIPDKSGVLSLLGIRYQVGPDLAKRRIELRFDPEAMHEIDVWHKGQFVERVRPLNIQAHRRPKARPHNEGSDSSTPSTPVVDWLGHLVERSRQKGDFEPSPRQEAEARSERRRQADHDVLKVLQDRLAEEVVEPAAVQRWLDRYGPVDSKAFSEMLDNLLDQGEPPDRYVTNYLKLFRRMNSGEQI